MSFWARSSSDESLSRCVDDMEKAAEYVDQNRDNEQNNEDLIDSQDIVTSSKKRKFNPNRIEDSDDEIDRRKCRSLRIRKKLIENDMSGSAIEDDDDENYSPGEILHDNSNRNSSSDSFICNSDEVDTNEDISDSSPDSEQEDDTDDSFICNSDQLETDEEEHINSYKEYDPRYLYDDKVTNKRPRKKKQKSSGDHVAHDDSQEVSIHKINLNHPKFSHISLEGLEAVIESIVNEYNSAKQNKFENKGVPVRYRPIVKPGDQQYFEGDDFEIKVYVLKVSKTLSLLKSYGVKEKATTIHSLIFHYRENELFAITTNQAWNVVQWCSDFEFPGKIAARILSRKGTLESTNKGLVGTELTRKTTHKLQKKTNPYDLLTFCTRFKAEIRDNASILKLSCFQKKNSVVSESVENAEEVEPARQVFIKVKGVKVTVSLGNIRILRRFSTSDILSILSVLSQISNGTITTDLDGKIEEDSTTHRKYLSIIHTEVAKELNVRLSKIIHDAIADDNQLNEMDNYQFCHKHTADFFTGHNFTLYHKNNEIKTFQNEMPTIRQIVMELKPYLGEIRSGSSEENYLQKLNKFKISYDFGGSGNNENTKKPEKFMNFIDGFLYHSRENSVFWHVNSMWCHVQEAYLYLVHNQFKSILNEFLLVDKTDPAYLKFSWPRNCQRLSNVNPNSKTKEYLDRYSNLEDTWISHTPGKDIIDMLKIVKDNATGKNVLIGYYLLPGPNYQTSFKCSYIAESVMQIGKVNSRMMGQNRGGNDDVAGSEDVRKELKFVYDEVSRKRKFQETCPNFNTFVKMITRAKFIIAIGRETSSGTDIPSLEIEKVMSTKITVTDIEDILNRMIEVNNTDAIYMLQETAKTMNQTFSKDRCQELAESIHQLLKQQEIIEGTGNSVTGKILNSNKISCAITNSQTVNEFLYEKIIYKYQPRVCTVLSKLAFIYLLNEINKLKLNRSFNLLEIPLNER